MHVGRVRSLHRYPVKSMAGESLATAPLGPQGVEGDRLFALRDEVRREIRGAKHWPALMRCAARTEDGDITVELPDESRFRIGERATRKQLDEALSSLVGTAVTLCALEPADNLDHYRRRTPGSRVAGTLARSKTAARALQRVMGKTGLDRELREMFGRERGEAMPDLSVFPAELFEFVSPPGTYFDAFPLHLLTTASLDALAERQPDAQWDARRFRPNLLLETPPGVSGFAELGWAGRELHVGEAVLRCEVGTPRCSMIMQPQQGLTKDPKVLRSVVRDADHVVGIYASVVRPGRVQVGDDVRVG